MQQREMVQKPQKEILPTDAPRRAPGGPQAVAPAAPAAPALAPQIFRAKPGRNTIMAKKTTMQWLLQNLSHPFPTCNDLEMLRQQTGIDTTKRMHRLVMDIRSKHMEQNEDGKWIMHDK
jgi:hypothetical protein